MNNATDYNNYTQENLLLSHIFGDLNSEMDEIYYKPLHEITIEDLPIIKQMPVLPAGVIIYDMKSGEKRCGNLEFTKTMKDNLVRFAKENAQDYLQKQNEQLN